MHSKLSWQGHSNLERNKSIEDLKDAISKNDGCIMNFNMFSDLAITLNIEIEENKIVNLHRSLKTIINISDLNLNEFSPSSSKDCMIYLNISFSKGTGNMKIEIPAVPG